MSLQGRIEALDTTPRPKKFGCQKPWHPRWADSKYWGKRQRLKAFHVYFGTGLFEDVHRDYDEKESKKRAQRARNVARAKASRKPQASDIATVSPMRPVLPEASSSALAESSGEAGEVACEVAVVQAPANDAGAAKEPEDLPGATVQSVSPPPPKIKRTAAVLTKRDKVTDEAVQMITGSIERRANSKLTANEKKLCSVLLRKMFQDSSEGSDVKVLDIPGMRGHRVARIPKNYNSSEDKRTAERRSRASNEWVSLLPPKTQEHLFVDWLENNPKSAAPHLVKFWNRKCRIDAKTTASIYSHAKISLEAAARFNRAVAYHSGGLRPLAPQDNVRKLKKAYVGNTFQSLKYSFVNLKRKVTTGSQTYFRDQKVMLVTIDPLEHVLHSASESLRSNSFVTYLKRFRIPFEKESGFSDVMLFKMSMDAGAGSEKMIMNNVNHSNPQSQQHVLPVFEFSGVKDTYHNVKKAAFNEDSKIKRGMEVIIHRRCVLLAVTVVGRTEVALATNTSSNHDSKKPTPLPSWSGLDFVADHTGSPPSNGFSVDIDFSDVESVRLRYNSSSATIDGVAYFGRTKEVLATSYFQSPIACSRNDAMKSCVNQILVAGVFTADLEFLSCFFGHQGASALFPCLFCFIKLRNMCDVFNNGSVSFQERTFKDIESDAATFNQKYTVLSLTEKNKSKARAKVTQQHTNSIVHAPMADVPLDCVSRADMHVDLGFTKALVVMARKCLRRLEKLVVESIMAQGESMPPQFVETIEIALENANNYAEYLQQLLSDEASLVQGQSRMSDLIMDSINSTMATLEREDLTGFERETHSAYLEELRGGQQEAFESMNTTGGEEADYRALVMEQMLITKQTKDELEQYLKNHEGNADRIVIAALKKFGVDLQVYHKDSIIGNQCMLFGERCKQIFDEIKSQMMPFMNGPVHEGYLESFGNQMSEIVSIWHDIQKVMKSTSLQSEETIAKFETDTDRLRRCLLRFISTDPPIPGAGLSLPRQLKTHLLFDGHILAWLKAWGTLGGISEQNIESTHAVWNELLRRFGSYRGVSQKKMVVEQFLFDRAAFIQKKNRDMLENTKRSKGLRSGSKRKESELTDMCDTEESVENNGLTSELVQLEMAINEEASLHYPFCAPPPDDDVAEALLALSILPDDRKHEYDAQRDGGDEFLGGVVDGIDGAGAGVCRPCQQLRGASPAPSTRNQQPAPHRPFDTRVAVCQRCAKRVLAGVMHIHMHEMHSGVIAEEADGAHDRVKILAAAGRA